MRVHFDLSDISPGFCVRWRNRIDTWLAADPSALDAVDDPADADAILILGRTHPWRRRAAPGLEAHHPERTLVWDADDFPTGRLPGLYAGLPRELHEPARHATFCYPFRWNQEIHPRPPEEAVRLAGFLGAITSPLRSRIIATLGDRPEFDLASADSLWHRMDDPASDASKRRYADHLAACRFALCPRGNGVSSVRLFEALETGRVPVVLSNRFVPPANPAWRECVLQFDERRLDTLPALLAAADAQWRSLALRVSSFWRENYADERLARTLAEQISRLLPARPPGPGHRVRLLRFASRQGGRDVARRIFRLLRQ